jgi:rhodanese-related sulfurtransferase
MTQNYRAVTREDLKRKLDAGENFLLVDVLSRASFEMMRIPGSINIDVGQPDFVENVQKQAGGDKGKEIVLYCSSATCQSSPAAARKLIEAGFTNIYHYAGGLADWKEGGYLFEGVAVEKQ